MEIAVLSETTELDIRAHEQIVLNILDSLLKERPSQVIFRRLESVHLQGKNDLLSQLGVLVDLFVNKYADLDFIILIVDSDDKSRNKQISEIQELISRKEFLFPTDNIIVGVAQRNIEAWILGDVSAVRKISNLSVPFYGKSEKIKEPKNKLKMLYASYCKLHLNVNKEPLRYSDFVYELAKCVTPQHLIKQSSSYAHFYKEISLSVKRLNATNLSLKRRMGRGVSVKN